MPKAKSRTLLTYLYLSAAALAFLPAGVAAGEETQAAKPAAEGAVVIPSPFVYGMRVWIDPDTGAIRTPSKAEKASVAERFSEEQRLNKSSEGLEIQYRADGSKFVDLQGRFMHSLVVTRGEDGKLTYHCVDGHGSEVENETETETKEEAPVR